MKRLISFKGKFKKRFNTFIDCVTILIHVDIQVEAMHRMKREERERRHDRDFIDSKDPNIRTLNEEIRELQKHYVELRKSGNHEEAESLQSVLREKV